MIVSVIGTRPQFIKAAAVSEALARTGVEEQVVHTGQHFDDNMSRVFFDTLSLPTPHCYIPAAAGNATGRFAAMLTGIYDYLGSVHPEAVLVYGDSDSTAAGALAAVRRHIPVMHIEAGLRSGNKTMPEEWNRLLTDRMASWLCCSSEAAVTQLRSEGIHEHVYNTGDVMLDVMLRFLPVAKATAQLPADLVTHSSDPFILATLHRHYNVDDEAWLQHTCAALSALPNKIIWPVHPRTAAKLQPAWVGSNIVLTGPLGYLEMLLLLHRCSRVITDSGGLQKEAYWMQKPCITLRPETEWHELTTAGCNILLPQVSIEGLALACSAPMVDFPAAIYGTGDAAEKIAAIVQNEIEK